VRQTAPDPEILIDLVKRTSYRPGWTVDLEDRQRDEDHGRGEGGGLTLVIRTSGYNSYHPTRGETYSVYHYFIVPAATYNERSWKRWLFDQFVKVETHEAMEFFALDAHCPGGGERPFAPVHAPGFDPYIIFESATNEEKATSYLGTVNPVRS
jgi:hypothetical protein